MDIKRGDIWYIESGYSVGSEQRAGRPAIVVSNNRNNQYSGTVEVVYLTTQPKRDLPTHVTISSLSRESTALCEQITSVSTERFGSYRAVRFLPWGCHRRGDGGHRGGDDDFPRSCAPCGC